MSYEFDELEEKIKMIIQDLAGSKDGIFFLAWLLDISNVFSSAYLENAQMSYFVEGKRSVGLTILTKLQEAKVLSKIMKEKENE